MSTATFTVPLTARVLRAILADIEGVDTLTSKCGCHAPATDRPGAPVNDVKAWEQIKGKVVDNQGIITERPGVELNEMDFAAIDYLCNEFDYGFASLPVDPTPLTSGIVEEGNPFILTPEGIVPVDEVTDPFVLQTATPPVPAPAPTVTPAPNVVLLDSEGLPWDKRIHASTRTKRVGDDTWKLMKGVDKALVEQVKAELRATMAANGPLTPAQPAAPTVPQHPAFAEPTNYSGAQSGGYVPAPPMPPVTVVPAPPAPPAPPVTVVPTVPGAPTTFSDFVTYATNKIVGKQFSRDQLQAACADQGITSMPMLENRPDLIPAIWKFLESISIQASSVGGE